MNILFERSRSRSAKMEGSRLLLFSVFRFGRIEKQSKGIEWDVICQYFSFKAFSKST
jgi:hypothetical protein